MTGYAPASENHTFFMRGQPINPFVDSDLGTAVEAKRRAAGLAWFMREVAAVRV
eukprot:CAMPEP_0183292564 /NCGR_PEP_ID=MMETSP0160_2-20130417/1572_1 /TAXON_ID=2839 ORGANISM="Odontella Sinensis, Strain Grunow 1884" /NCGR_SAMPLE_ID=MMETSP0160_2 /ASSEMBLY_ACC=CAM_ASM_000250 /LENGTH=53 /DNA_ID=CAMNT_0025453533 /DNA_START=337 /DNA_END=498 /DNA_ORIENTATION=-